MCNPVNSNTGIYNSRTNNSLGTIIKRRLTRRRRLLTADDETQRHLVKTGASDAAVGKINRLIHSLISSARDFVVWFSQRTVKKKLAMTISRTGIVYIQLKRHQTKSTQPILTRDLVLKKHGDVNKIADERV